MRLIKRDTAGNPVRKPRSKPNKLLKVFGFTEVLADIGCVFVERLL